MGGSVKTRPVKLTACLVHRETLNTHARKMFSGRIPLQIYLKLAAWVYSLSDEYPPEKYRLVVHVEPDGDPRTRKLVELLRKNGIIVAEEVVAAVS